MSCEYVPDKLINTMDDYTEYEEAVYQEYMKTFSNKEFYFNGKRIAEKKHPLIAGKSCTFWHIISSGDCEAEKLPDYDRYETVGWPGFILGYCLDNCKEKLIWETKRRSKIRVLIYCTEIDYLVVLDKREDYYIFWTAYPVKYDHTKRKLLQEYEDFLKKQS